MSDTLPFVEALARARADYQAALGTIIEVRTLSGYVGDSDIQQDYDGDQPFMVRVLATADDDLHHVNDDWLDPYWNVEVVSPDVNLRSCWTFGPSYHIEAKR
jgi:hypothetical protein